MMDIVGSKIKEYSINSVPNSVFLGVRNNIKQTFFFRVLSFKDYSN